MRFRWFLKDWGDLKPNIHIYRVPTGPLRLHDEQVWWPTDRTWRPTFKVSEELILGSAWLDEISEELARKHLPEEAFADVSVTPKNARLVPKWKPTKNPPQD